MNITTYSYDDPSSTRKQKYIYIFNLAYRPSDKRNTNLETLTSQYIYIRYILTVPSTHVRIGTISRKNLQKNSRKI